MALGVAGINDVRFGTASRCYFSSGIFHARLILVGANHRRTERCELLGGCLANTGCGTKNQRDLAIEAESIPISLQPFLDPSHADFNRSDPVRPFAGISSRYHCPHKRRSVHTQDPSMRGKALCWVALSAFRRLQSF